MSGFKEFTFWVSPPEPRSPFDRALLSEVEGLRANGILADSTEVSRMILLHVLSPSFVFAGCLGNGWNCRILHQRFLL